MEQDPLTVAPLATDDAEDDAPYVNERARMQRIGQGKPPLPQARNNADRRDNNKNLDWASIEREYRLGQLAIREMARAHGCHETLIRRRAKKFGWTRDLKHRVQEAIRDRTIKQDAVAVAGGEQLLQESDPDDDSMMVAAAAERGAEVIREHRVLLGNGKALIARLQQELADASTYAQSLLDAVKLASAAGGRGNQALLRYAERVASVHTRSMAANQLAHATKTMIVEERRAYNLDDDRDKVDALDSILQSVRRSDAPVASARQRLEEQASDTESERWLDGAHFHPKEDDLH